MTAPLNDAQLDALIARLRGYERDSTADPLSDEMYADLQQAAAALSQLRRERGVPREPTDAMMVAGNESTNTPEEIWRAMHDAAPKQSRPIACPECGYLSRAKHWVRGSVCPRCVDNPCTCGYVKRMQNAGRSIDPAEPDRIEVMSKALKELYKYQLPTSALNIISKALGESE